MRRILIADDHKIIREGIKQILLEEFSLGHIEEAFDGAMLVEKAQTGDWDIIVSDIAMPKLSGIEALRLIKRQFPKLPVLLLSMHSEEQYVRCVLKEGASGYLCKDAATKELITAVKTILLGRKYVSPSIAGTFTGEDNWHTNIT
jgi:DNA-binding NarL/FixJ family response regulator